MAKSTAEERRLRRVGLAESAEERARSRRLDADYADRGGDFARAAVYREAAARHEASARQHRQEAARLERRAKARCYRTDPAEKARQALAAVSSPPAPASDCLDRYGAALAELAAIRAAIAALELRLSELPRQAPETVRARLLARIETQRARALEWEREAARYAQASHQNAEPSGNSGELADHADLRKNAN